MMVSNRQRQEDTAHLQTALDHLAEKFDNVCILVSSCEKVTGDHYEASLGYGNVFAQLGQMDTWLRRMRLELTMEIEEEDE